MNIEKFNPQILRCPDCREGYLDYSKISGLTCCKCSSVFLLVGSRPVLMRHDNQIFPIDAYVQTEPAGPRTMKFPWIPSPSVNLASSRVIGALSAKLNNLGHSSTILVVGGGRQRVWLDQLLSSHNHKRQIIYTDIDASADVDLFCDGHDLPFQDGSFDAVIITAVLEHVLHPERAAAEIFRVLRPEGFLYSEMPFMQQVHEGAYDFTRYTLSGHRRLFNGFHEIDAGMIAGPGTALVWAIENFFLAFTSKKRMRNLIKASIRITFFWIKYFDYFLSTRPEAMDGASCTYFLGSRAEKPVSDCEIISSYVGAKHLTHL